MPVVPIVTAQRRERHPGGPGYTDVFGGNAFVSAQGLGMQYLRPRSGIQQMAGQAGGVAAVVAAARAA